MKFSVLLPIYKNDNLNDVKKALNSIINQTLLPNEIVIIQDGEIDNSLIKLLSDFYENNKEIVVIYKRTEHKGLGETLKEGVNKCRYEYIARQDADEFSIPNRFKIQIDYLIKYPDTDVLGGYMKECYINSKIKYGIRKLETEDKNIKKQMKAKCAFNHGSVIIKKQTLLDVGNYSEVVDLEDYELWARMQKNNCIMHNIPQIFTETVADDKYFKRRSGAEYVTKIKEIEKILYNYKIINYWEYIFNIIIRSVVALVPNNVRTKIYKLFLREK